MNQQTQQSPSGKPDSPLISSLKGPGIQLTTLSSIIVLLAIIIAVFSMIFFGMSIARKSRELERRERLLAEDQRIRLLTQSCGGFDNFIRYEQTQPHLKP